MARRRFVPRTSSGKRGGSVGTPSCTFGPFPALLRVLPDLLAPSRYGLWSRASVFLAVLLCLGAIVAIARRQLAENEQIDARGRTVLFFATLAAVGLGSSLVLVGSLANLYHEAILWGLCAALWGVFFTLGVLRDDARAWRSLALLSGAAGAAFLSRVTFGLPLYALASGLALRLLVLQVRRDRQPLLTAASRVALALLPAIAAGLFHLWYNHARFGSPFEFAPFAAYDSTPKGMDSAFHWSRMPSGALAYFRISLENFSLRVPFLTFALPSVFRPELYRDLTNIVISPLLVSPWLVVGLVGGGLLPGSQGSGGCWRSARYRSPSSACSSSPTTGWPTGSRRSSCPWRSGSWRRTCAEQEQGGEWRGSCLRGCLRS